MLNSFESIKKVGLFENYFHSSDCSLGAVTLIYGENGVGKSTLAAILDSFGEGNPAEIIRRRSLPGDVVPTVTIRLSDKIYSFNGSDWDYQPPYDTIDIFYPGFVNRNVHAATQVDADHRRNLCEFVFGKTAVEKLSKLAKTDNDARSALSELKMVEKEISLLFKKPDTIETFLGLPVNPLIDEGIEKVRSELKQAQSKDAILRRHVPKVVDLPKISQNEVVELLEKNTDSLGMEVTGIIREHINQHLDVDGEKWLLHGATYFGAQNKCPFCGQDLVGSKLTVAIRSYFSDEYRAYMESLNEEIKAVRENFGSGTFSRVRDSFLTQIGLVTQWTDIIPFDQTTVTEIIIQAEAVWMSALGKLETLIAKKLMKPLEKMESALAEETIKEYGSAETLLGKVKEVISNCIVEIEKQKANLSKADTTEIEQRLNRLENQKVRFGSMAQKLILNRTTLIEKREKLDEEKTVLKKEIDEHATRVVGKYQAGINYYLGHFSCDIRIESFESKFPSGKASVQYTLKVHSHEIGLGFSAVDPCFETVLSEGDKYTLALAFFFARLKDHADLTGRIVVLDDPVNSLGTSRRTLIAGVVRDLRVRGAQVVVLTHDERLAAMIWRDKKLNKDIVSLQVERTGTGSSLKPWNVERATQSEYVTNYLELDEYLKNGGDHKKPASCIRPYVEQRLRHLFPGPPFQTHNTLGQMIGIIRDSAIGSRLRVLVPKLPDLESLNDAALPSHHATDDVPGMPPLTQDAVRIFAQKALDVLG